MSAQVGARNWLRYPQASCDSYRMSEGLMSGSVPEWDTADRMRKAMRTADVGVQEMASTTQIYLDARQDAMTAAVLGVA